nr:MAG TPA: hypothetical protein [Caudoviricetes sp.]
MLVIFFLPKMLCIYYQRPTMQSLYLRLYS